MSDSGSGEVLEALGDTLTLSHRLVLLKNLEKMLRHRMMPRFYYLQLPACHLHCSVQ